MEFTLERTSATFAKKLQIRQEGNGDTQALDISFTVTTEADILEQLVPPRTESDDNNQQEKGHLVRELYSTEGYLRRPALNTINVQRKPEGITVLLHDPQTDDDEPVKLTDCSFKSIVATLQEPHQVELHGLLQIPKVTKAEITMFTDLLGGQAPIEWFADQIDLFSSEGGESSSDDGESEDEAGEPENEGNE